MTTTKVIVQTGDLGYVVYIGSKRDTGVSPRGLGAVIRKDGASVKTPVLLGDYTGSTPGQALDAILLDAERVFEAVS
jgi:hypothetical protein